MAEAREDINYEPYDFRNSTFLIDKTDVAQSVNKFSAERINDNAALAQYNDGTAQVVILPGKGIRFTLEMAEASPQTDTMWDLYEAGEAFSLAFTDKVSPKLKANGKVCYFEKLPPVERDGEPGVPVWTFFTPYGDVRGGSINLIAS
jgi:hypothetical protein